MVMTAALKAKYSDHIGKDVTYPADCNDLVTACEGMSEFSAGEKDWFTKTLPHGMFKNANEVKKAIHL